MCCTSLMAAVLYVCCTNAGLSSNVVDGVDIDVDVDVGRRPGLPQSRSGRFSERFYCRGSNNLERIREFVLVHDRQLVPSAQHLPLGNYGGRGEAREAYIINPLDTLALW